MIQKIVLVMALLIFTLGVAGLEHSEDMVNDSMGIETDSDADMRVTTDISKESARCVLRLESGGTDQAQAGNVQASLNCPGEGAMHTDDWITARLVDGSDSRAPEEVAVVSDPVRCPDGVCYGMSSGSIDVTVVNDPPAMRGNVGNPAFEQNDLSGEMPETREISTTTVVTYESFSISKRQARTGRNPQTGTKALKKGDRISQRSEQEERKPDRLPEEIKPEVNRQIGNGKVTVIIEIAEKGGEVDAGRIETGVINTGEEVDILGMSQADCPEKCSYPVNIGDSDSDADGMPDLAVVQTSNNSFNWTVSNKTVAKATLNETQVGGTRIIFVQVEGTGQQSMNKAELIEAMASHAGLSKADSKKALEGFTDTTTIVAINDPECCFDYNSDVEPSSEALDRMDRTTPEPYQELEQKDKRIAELEERIRELESGREVSSSVQESPETADDQVVGREPGRSSLDDDSDGDGLSDAVEEESDEPVRRPGFVDRMLSTIFRR